MRRAVPLTLALVAACAQQAPPVPSLPDVGELVPEPQPCVLLVGEPLGARVEEVTAGSAAEGTLQPGDVLVGVGGAEVRTIEELREALSAHAVGERVGIDFLRDGDRLGAEVVLGAATDEPGRPLLGVMAVTSYMEIEPDDLLDSPVEGPLQRAVDVNGSLLVLDPTGPTWATTGSEAPESAWVAAGDRLFRLDTSAEQPVVVDLTSGERVGFDLEGWQPLNLLGSIGSRLIMSVARPLEDDPSQAEVGVGLADPEEHVVGWLWQVDRPGLGVPVAAFPSPDGQEILVALSDQEASTLRYVVLGADGALRLDPESLAALENGLALGWYDDRRLLVQASDGTVSEVSLVDGSAQPKALPLTLTNASRLWAVGDGTHLLAEVGGSLVVTELEEASPTRVLSQNCVVGSVSDLGFGP